MSFTSVGAWSTAPKMLRSRCGKKKKEKEVEEEEKRKKEKQRKAICASR